MIPDYQSLMLPLLKLIENGEVYKMQEVIQSLAAQLSISIDDLSEWLPSKRQKTFDNRVHWAKAHLKMAGALENIKKGYFKITDKGKAVLAGNPSSINVKYLMDLFPEYNEKIIGFRSQGRIDNKEHDDSIEEVIIKETPEELIESGYQKIKDSLEEEILSKLKLLALPISKKLSWNFLLRWDMAVLYKMREKQLAKAVTKALTAS